MGQFYFLSALIVILQVYTYFAVTSLVKSPTAKWIILIVYVALGALVIFSIYNVYQAMINRNMFSTTRVNFNIGVLITALVTLIFFAALLLLQDVGRGLTGVVKYVTHLIGDVERPDRFIPGRRKALTSIATALAAIPLGTMIYGITKGKYNYKVSNVSLSFKDLPAAFDGFKIVQISDIHAGSLDNPEQVLRGVELVNDQDPDIITFTGDMVNSDKNEVDPFMDIFSQLKAKQGKYAVLGNHDYYGLYKIEDAEHPAYWEDFYGKFKSMGFNLLNNDSALIEKDGSSIRLAGVENWGAGRWFPKKGDLTKALADVNPDEFTVLMSHDPTHWAEKVVSHDKHINLTLSGHTHGMQFGINMPGFKWSPAQMRYKHWMGLYEDAKQYLYVNRGFGFLAFPGRIGMWPEITVIELKTA